MATFLDILVYISKNVAAFFVVWLSSVIPTDQRDVDILGKNLMRTLSYLQHNSCSSEE